MAMVKKKTNWKKMLVAVIAIIACVIMLQFILIGWYIGIGPFNALRKNRINKMEGNGQEYDFSNITQMENSPLAGEKICILGSSSALGSASGEQAVGEYLAARFGAELYKETANSLTLSGQYSASYISRLKTIPAGETFHLFLCQLSTDDAAASLPLGEIEEGKEPEGFDVSTVTGAMEYIIAYVKETWHCPVAFFTVSHYGSEKYGAMVEALKGLQEKWGIGVLDLWTDAEFNTISQERRSLYMSDEIHPTRAGYSLWWGPELERQLLDFLGDKGSARKGENFMAGTNCEMCVNYVYDEEDESYRCLVSLDEDEMYRFLTGSNRACPYFRLDDEYGVARKQM